MNMMIVLITGSLAAGLTFLLNNRLEIGGVIASAGISVVGGLFFFLFPDLLNKYLTINIPTVIMGASFVGMASEKVIPQARIIFLSGILFSVVYLLTGSFFEGFGGSLGTSAAISLISVFGLKNLIRLRSSA